MVSTIQSNNDLNAVNSRETVEREVRPNSGIPATPSTDPQVKAKRSYSPRRSFDTAYKLRIIAAYDICKSALERGALLRREGLYHSRIASWKQELAKGKFCGKRKSDVTPRTDHLVRENQQLKKKLAQAEAIIDLQKKVSELLGTHILPHESSEVNS